MMQRHFDDELGRLKGLAAEFARDHPALAPMLLGSSSDPDVERLLEGVAFLTAMLRTKLDDAFPEFIQELTGLLFPHYLLAMPAAAMVELRPRAEAAGPLRVAAGTELVSVPVDGTACRFRTCHDLEVAPWRVAACSLQQPTGRAPALRLLLRATPGAESPPRALRVYLHGSHADACNLLLLLTRHLRGVRLSWQAPLATQAGQLELDPQCVRMGGFDQPLLDYPAHAFDGYRILQEYFSQPAKFLFVVVEGLPKLPAGVQQLQIDFVLDQVWPWMPDIRDDSLLLGVVPAVNLFELDAEPIELDHRSADYLLEPQASPREHHPIRSVLRVQGLEHGEHQPRTWRPFQLHAGSGEPGDAPGYRCLQRRHPLRAGEQTVLSLQYVAGRAPPAAVLSVRLECSNGALPQSLGPGDICRPGLNAPDRIDIRNLQPPSPARPPRLDADLMWRLQAHAALNYFSLADAATLRSLLALYVDAHAPAQGPEAVALQAANRRRIEGIESVRARADSLVVGACSVLRGQRMRVACRSDHFAGVGDLYLFGCVLEAFLADYAGINSFVLLELEDTHSSTVFTWPARIGTRPTI